MSRLAILGVVLAALTTAGRVWADHGAGLRSEGMSPITAALVWAAAAFLVGMAIVAIVTVLGRRRSSPSGSSPRTAGPPPRRDV